jgi:pimeloyl-ACP methyl ester carboxylesterase
MRGAGMEQLVLIGPMGIKPETGYIFDQFIVSTGSYARQAFSDPAVFDALYGEDPTFDQLESWETDREMTSRVAWKPYMYNATLPRLLAGVREPALIVTGEEDRIVPVECSELYQKSLPNAALKTIPGAGHAVELEKPETVAELVSAFCRSAKL